MVSNEALKAVELDIEKVDARIEALLPKIEKAEGKIDDAEKAGEKDAVQQWFTNLQQLRETENKLHEEKIKLLDAKARLQPAGKTFETSVPPVGADMEGINSRRNGGFFSPRLTTVHKILVRNQEKKVLIITGTPSAGKTSICQLVREEAMKSNLYERVYYTNCARVGDGGRSFENVFEEQNGVAFSDATRSPSNSPQKQQSASSSNSLPQPSKLNLHITDETQKIYDPNTPGHAVFWNWVKEVLDVDRPPINILITASRGSNPAADGLASTPITFGYDQRIPLRPRPDFSTVVQSAILGPEPALQFTNDEFGEVFASFCKRVGLPDKHADLQLLSDVIEATTERHPGTVLRVLDMLQTQSPWNSVTETEWATKAVQYVTSPLLLRDRSGTRSFPNVDKFLDDNEARDIVTDLLRSQGKKHLDDIRKLSLSCSEKAQRLARAGYMIMEDDWLSFTSQLHMEFYRYYLSRRTWGTVGSMPTTIESFLMEVLSRMEPPVFQNSLNVSSKGKVLEAHFHFELYAATASLLPVDAYLSPTVGTIYKLQAYVDFVLHPQMWALELLVDGSKLKEHEDRFLPNGRYHPMVFGGQIAEWVVLDLRNPTTGPPRLARGPQVCHVFFDKDYKQATVRLWNRPEQVVMLAGRSR